MYTKAQQTRHRRRVKTRKQLLQQKEKDDVKKIGLCECGCGSYIKPPRRFVSGHNLRRKNPNYIYRNGRSYTIIKCDGCGKEVERRTDQVKRHKRNFCSQKCAGNVVGEERKGKQLKRRGREITCKICGKKFYVPPSKIDAKFCSFKCHGEWLVDHPRNGFISGTDNKGKKNGRYKDGKRIGENTSKKKIREEVIVRDGNWCLICGKPPKGLHLHRVIYGSQGGKYEKDNNVQLCNIDHEKVHMDKKLWQPRLLEYIEISTKEQTGTEPTSPPSYQIEWHRKYVENSPLLI